MAWVESGLGVRLEGSTLLQCLGSFGPDLYVVVKPWDVAGFRIYRSPDNGDNWELASEKTNLFQSTGAGSSPSMAIDAQGLIHIGYSRIVYISGNKWVPHYATYDITSGVWSEYGAIDTSAATAEVRCTMLHLDPTGNPYILKAGNWNNQYFAWRVGGAWTSKGWISANNPPSIVRAGMRSNGEIFYINGNYGWRRDPSTGVWSGTSLGSVSPQDQSVAAWGGTNPNDIHCAYSSGSALYHLVRSGDTWSAHHLICSKDQIDPSVTGLNLGSLCISSSDKLRISFMANNYPIVGNRSLYECISDDGGLAWSTPIPIKQADATWSIGNNVHCYFPSPVEGAALVCPKTSGSNYYLFFYRSDDFNYVTRYGPWRTWTVSGEDIPMVVI